MKPLAIALTVPLFAVLWSAPPACAQGSTQSIPMPPPAPPPASSRPPSSQAQAWVQKHLAGWPERTQRLAAPLVTHYGPPTDVSERQVTWYGNGPWKRTTLYKAEVPHNFAHVHQDVLEQTIDYRVPIDKLAPLAQFNGSLVVNRTRGELSSISDGEDMNFLALNVADDLVKGDRDVEQAMTYFAQLTRARMIKEAEPDLQRLHFTPAKPAQAADPGEIAPLIKHMANNSVRQERPAALFADSAFVAGLRGDHGGLSKAALTGLPGRGGQRRRITSPRRGIDGRRGRCCFRAAFGLPCRSALRSGRRRPRQSDGWRLGSQPAGESGVVMETAAFGRCMG
ncbi:MAG: hypothetical protein ACREXP_25735, partial [Steroidobacteraceae bacterium]